MTALHLKALALFRSVSRDGDAVIADMLGVERAVVMGWRAAA